MSDEQTVQAAGQDGAKGAPDGVGDAATHGKSGGGESSGGAYPNPHAGKKPEGQGGFLGHGGQSEINYHGPDQLGDTDVPGDNPNAATKRED